MNPRYVVALTRKQLQTLSDAAELFARLRIGQFSEVLWKVYPELAGDPRWELSGNLLESAGVEVRGRGSNQSSQSEWSESSNILWDIHQAFSRANLSTTEMRTAIVRSNEPFPLVKVNKELPEETLRLKQICKDAIGASPENLENKIRFRIDVTPEMVLELIERLESK